TKAKTPAKAAPAGKTATVKAETPAPADKAAGAPANAGNPAPPDATPPTGSPMAELKKSNNDLDKVLKRNVPNWTPEAELQRTEVRKIVGWVIHYNELRREC